MGVLLEIHIAHSGGFARDSHCTLCGFSLGGNYAAWALGLAGIFFTPYSCTEIYILFKSNHCGVFLVRIKDCLRGLRRLDDIMLRLGHSVRPRPPVQNKL